MTVALLLIGCSASKTPNYEVEVVTIDAQMLEDLNSTPTTFVVDIVEDHYAWERAQTFFRDYANTKPRLLERRGRLVLFNQPAEGTNFIYSVEKERQSTGIRYTVECQTQKLDPAAAQLNAHNLARFIRDGTLELSLLNR